MRPKIYLAGTITGATYGECTDWREWAEREFARQGIEALSPMRGKKFLSQYEEPIPDYRERKGLEYVSSLDYLTGGKAIVTRDRNDVRTCDAVLMNLLKAPRISIGTTVELGWADAFRKPVVLVWEGQESLHFHEFYNQLAGFQVGDVKTGVRIATILVKGGEYHHEYRARGEEGHGETAV